MTVFFFFFYSQDQGLSLISSGELKELPDLLSSEFSPLRPLLLLLGWDRYPHQGSGRELLETLWPDQVVFC